LNETRPSPAGFAFDAGLTAEDEAVFVFSVNKKEKYCALNIRLSKLRARANPPIFGFFACFEAATVTLSSSSLLSLPFFALLALPVRLLRCGLYLWMDCPPSDFRFFGATTAFSHEYNLKNLSLVLTPFLMNTTSKFIRVS
jgi:hypothetical protein